MSDMIHVAALSRSYDGAPPAVYDLNFVIRRGEIFSLLGPNGAGKTTTIRLIAGLIGATSGSVHVNGLDVSDRAHLEAVHQILGVLPESPGLYEELSAFRNLQFFGRLQGMSDVQIRERAHGLLSALDLWDRRDEIVATFSKGMKQKIAIVRALLHDPECLIMDEPVSGLDPEAAKTVRDYLITLRAEGKTIFLSTHNLDDADRLSDRVAVLRGRLLAVDRPSELKQKLFQRTVRFRVDRIDDATFEALRSHPAVRRAERLGADLQLDLNEPEIDNPDIVSFLVARGVRIRYVEPVTHTLEEVYLKLVESEPRRPSSLEAGP